MVKLDNVLRRYHIHLKTDQGQKSTGHTIDTKSFSIHQSKYIPWITKYNKRVGQAGVEASLLEASFSELARLFIKPDCTPCVKVVLDEQEKVIGIASENINFYIRELIHRGQLCYKFDPNNWVYDPILLTNSSKESIKQEYLELQAKYPDENLSMLVVHERLQLKEAQQAVFFLDKMPQNFFATLMKKYREGEIEIDMDSLASILTASYVLEEDDLHKGNIGFYVTDGKDTGKKEFRFFKIDHDLMFNESIMSKRDMRLANLFYNQDSFKFTVQDLEGFPDLQHSGNHYWPTKKRLLVHGKKAYTYEAERKAFASLKDDQAFKDAKWKYFLKYSLMPTALIEQSLQVHLDLDDDLDKLSMVRNAACSRIEQLKHILLTSSEFLAYVKSRATSDVKKAIVQEISEYLKHFNMPEREQYRLLKQMEVTFDIFVKYAQSDKHSTLGKSILLDCYEFSPHHKPTDEDISYAKDKFRLYQINHDLINAFKYACIVSDLTKNSEDKDIEQFKENYLMANSITNLDDFNDVADKIRQSSLPLKQQKNELLGVLKKANLSKEALSQLKAELKKKEPTAPSLKFIHQLRNDLWFIRKVFGTYGKTTTSRLMMSEIDRQLKQSLIQTSKLFKDKLRPSSEEEQTQFTPQKT